MLARMLIAVLCVLALSVWANGQALKTPTVESVPKEYADKHMPAGWWTDPKVIAEGKQTYDGLANAMVTCFACHGPDGTPMLREARNLKDATYVNKMTDSYWFWRISEGVPGTQMAPFKAMLKENKIWEVIAYEHTFSHGGKPEEHKH